MKILFMATRDWFNPAAAGGDIQMWEYARFLASRGHTVTFLASVFPGARREETLEGVSVVRLGKVHSLWLRSFLYYVSRCRGRYDVVITEGFGGSRIPRLAPLYVREPIVTEWHQIHRGIFAAQYPGMLVPLLNVIERLTAFVHRNTLVRVGTPEWREAFPRIGFRMENVFVVPVSIREEWLADFTPSLSHDRVVWLGKFRRYKCAQHVLLAMKDVLAQVPRARVTLAGRRGDRRYEEYLRCLSMRLNIEENVEFRFNITEREKMELLRGARVLVLPSPVEGFGIVALEANACGVPVVASSGVPQSVVKHEHNGLRYPFGEIDALGQAVARLLRDEQLHSRLAANSLAFARQFAWHEVGSQFERLVEIAVARMGGVHD